MLNFQQMEHVYRRARHAKHSGSGYCSEPEAKSPAGAGLKSMRRWAVVFFEIC